ncbi:unnamed protein product [Rotaria sp. Silwood1]|nr:unnamed protein product [Rotaria sp. Silwood1]
MITLLSVRQPSQKTESVSWDTLDPFSVFDVSENGATTPKSSTVTRQSKPVVSSSTLPPSALQAPYQRGTQLASTAADQIQADKMEVTHIIANYAVEPLEMLHLVDRWLQQLLGEFLQQRDHFKHRLGEKWQNQELTNIKYDDKSDRIRKINNAYKELERARDTILSRESFDELNNYLRTVDDTTRDEIKEKFNLLLQDYFRILQCLRFIDRETKSSNADNNINDIKKNLMKLKELNNKQTHTICIVGLEKAGKSTFINALLGYEILPTASERCTQIRTVLKPTFEDSGQQLFATVKFYDDQEFHVLFDKMTKKTDENQQQLDQRKAKVIEDREILKGKFPEEHFYITGRIDENRERASIIDQLHKYITGEVYINIIKEIAIYTDRLPGTYSKR